MSIAGVVSIFFLVWRAISADRSSKAALRQARAALGQIEIATKQIEIASKQSDAAAKQSEAAIKQATIARDRQITDILSRAIDQLGSDKSAIIRAGAIYTLGRIVNDSSRDHGRIMQMIEGYVRTEARRLHDENQEQQASDVLRAHNWLKTIPPWLSHGGTPINQEEASKFLEEYKERIPELLHTFVRPILDADAAIPQWQKMIGQYHLSSDVQACLTVLGSRNGAHEPDTIFITLRDTDWRGANLSGLNLRQTCLGNADRRGAGLVHTIVKDCVAVGADFSGTLCVDARFNDSNLAFCNFDGANVEGANFDGADLGGANLRKAIGITREQLRHARIDENTRLPDGTMFDRCPKRWRGYQSGSSITKTDD